VGPARLILAAFLLSVALTIGENRQDDTAKPVTTTDDVGTFVSTNGLASGEATRFGRSYQAENYYEVLSDAVVNTVSSMLSGRRFSQGDVRARYRANDLAPCSSAATVLEPFHGISFTHLARRAIPLLVFRVGFHPADLVI
jgi:hypothetical protein